jgi:ribose transport system substrate-binding protein
MLVRTAKISGSMLLAASMLVLTGCSGSGTAATGTGGTNVKITGVMPLQDNPYFKSMCQGATLAAKEEGVELKWTGTSTADTADLLNALNAVGVAQPDGILIDPFDPVAFVRPVRALMEKGTKVIAVDNALAEHVDVTNIRTDGFAAAADAGKRVGEMLEGKGTVAILGMTPTGSSAVARTNGFIEGLKASPGIKILPTQYEEADTAKAADVVSGLIQANPGLTAVYSVADAGGSGAASAIKAAGKVGKILNITFDAGPELVAGLRSGTFDALIAQDPYNMGYEAVKTLAAIERGKGKAEYPQHTEVGYQWLTRDNIDDKAVSTYLYAASC